MNIAALSKYKEKPVYLERVDTVIKAILLGVFGVGLAPFTYAGCSAINGWDNKRTIINFPSQIVVQTDAPSGMPFYTTVVNGVSNGEQYAQCGGRITVGTKYVNGWSVNGDGIALTNVEGVGIRLSWMADGVTPYIVPMDPMSTFIAPDGYIMRWRNNEPAWKIELIKIGRISGGALRTGDYAVFGIGGTLITTLSIGGGGTIVPVGCTVTRSNISVPMGKSYKSEFRGVGSSTEWQDFDIPLECHRSAKINVRIDAPADRSVPGLMRLDDAPGDMAASGVGIQLYYRSADSPVIFGQETFYRQLATERTEAVQLKARYYQTNERITPGTANGTATFTITYK